MWVYLFCHFRSRIEYQQLRRFQIKFVSDRDYYTALALLGEINCPLTEGSAPSVPSSRRLPSTMSLNSEYAPSLATSYTGEPHTSPAIPFHHSAAYRPAMATTTSPPLSCSGSASLITSYLTRPSVRSIGPSNNRAQATLQRHQDTPSFNHEPMRRTNTYTLSSTTVPYHDVEQLNQMLPPRSEQVRRTSTTTTAARPTISAAHHDIESLSHDLPPKRNLPFSTPNPIAKRPRTNAVLQTQTPSSTPRPPSSQLPHARPELNERQDSHANAPLRGLSRCASNIQVFQSQPPSPTPTQLHPQRLPTQRVHLHSPKPPPIFRPNTFTERSTDLDDYTSSAAQLCPDIPPNTTFITQPETQSQNQHQNPRPQPPAHPPSLSSSSIELSLSQYFSAPTAERTAMLENWMCELLEDDKFMVLCEDVEGVWRRFAFGKKT
ncbi:hypothetical protein N7510_005721 [Penicillium lagena]|uniref:uncharacterized protein n=1 Tax=Penicillium lagena TaxID=94218 RepID=UPI0025414284|nr:uncharacterized protein N7510_005721 [Penicillium lagena]KAJ5612527.1 hypothetical protein N7510_005721 [Penicillium lagena]